MLQSRDAAIAWAVVAALTLAPVGFGLAIASLSWCRGPLQVLACYPMMVVVFLLAPMVGVGLTALGARRQDRLAALGAGVGAALCVVAAILLWFVVEALRR